MGKAFTFGALLAGLAAHRLALSTGLLVLSLGTAVYVFDRPLDTAPSFNSVHVDRGFPGLFGPLGQSLPTFAHAFALSILTAVLLGSGKRVCAVACLAWIGIDSAFEIGQHASVAERLVSFVPDWFDRLPVLNRADGFFLTGTFDPWDLVSIAAGGIAAFLAMTWIETGDADHE